tara:strand:- start:477 stop:701 length:225 start_codon:yes stop_codon:yes gene_type:complete
MESWVMPLTSPDPYSFNKFFMIKLGTSVQHKLHDDLNGDVVQLNRSSNTATVKYWINDYEPMLVSCYLSDLEVA